MVVFVYFFLGAVADGKDLRVMAYIELTEPLHIERIRRRVDNMTKSILFRDNSRIKYAENKRTASNRETS